MVDFGRAENSSRNRWVCPNDRHLALRAKLKTGWSVKSDLRPMYVKHAPNISDQERDIIKNVIKKAEDIDRNEQQRVGRLVEKLENMKRCAVGNGMNECVLCAEKVGFLASASWICNDCKKVVCYKCGIETTSPQKKTVALCKICSETREMWKKSGAWFFKDNNPCRLMINKNHGEIPLTATCCSNTELTKTELPEWAPNYKNGTPELPFFKRNFFVFCPRTTFCGNN